MITEEELLTRLDELRNDFYEQTGNFYYNDVDGYFMFLVNSVKGNWKLQQEAEEYLEKLLIE